jgi:hypothetical protein
MRSRIAETSRPKEDGLTKRYGRIGIPAVAAAAPYQAKGEKNLTQRTRERVKAISAPKPENHPCRSGNRNAGHDTRDR